MGKYQDKILTGGIGHAKGHLVMIVFAEIGVKLHVLQKIVHPTHIPLKLKAKTIIFWFSSYHRPSSRFLGNNHSTFTSLIYNTIEVAEEFDSFQIFIFTIFVSYPVASRTAII